jgi:hypothetical protein
MLRGRGDASAVGPPPWTDLTLTLDCSTSSPALNHIAGTGSPDVRTDQAAAPAGGGHATPSSGHSLEQRDVPVTRGV